MDMTNEEIFDTAEFYGWQDDFGRWNFTDEGLVNFVLDLLQTGGTSEDSPTEGWEPEEKNT
jgi:hypothetical protein